MPPKSDPPSVYMKDKDFRAALEVKNQKRKEVLGVREKLLQELEKRVDAMREKLSAAGREGTPGTENAGTPVEVDDAMVKKELEKDPEWNSLIKRIEDTNAAYDDNRKAATKLVAERLAARKQKPLK